MLLNKSKLKNIFLRLSGRYSFMKKDRHCAERWYGTQYGGTIMNPKLLSKDSIVYSFGIGEDISFDLDVIRTHDCKVYGFDPTPKSIKWVESQETPPNFLFYEWGISDKTGEVDFFLPKNTEHVSGSLSNQSNIDLSNKVTVQVKTLKDIMNELNHTSISVLKIDIEGSEYEVIDEFMSNESIPIIPQLLIEYHGRFFPDGIQKTKDSITKLKAKGYKIFAVSNNFVGVSLIHESSL